ncbi:signal peptidase I [Haloparvum sp. AD34]
MTPRTAGIVLFAVVVGAFLAPPTAPVGVSFLESDSMEPTVNVGDGVVLVPAGTVEPGDIVTFRSDHRDEFVTHRVVGETEAGYVTQGDNNDVTDQAAGHPPVPADAIVGQVLTVADAPVAIPGIGTAAIGIQRHRGELIALLVVGFVATAFRGSRPRRTPFSEGRLFRLALVAGTIAAVVPMLVGGSAIGLTLTDAADPTGSNTITVADEPTTIGLDTPSHRLLTTVVTAEGATVHRTEWVDGSLQISLSRPDSRSGVSDATLHVYQYPPLLPARLLAWLQALHPAVAGVGTTAVMYAPIVLYYRIASLPGTPVRSRSRATSRGESP